MSNAVRDDNRQPVIQGVSSADFTTPTTPAVDPSTHALLVNASISSSGGSISDGVSAAIKATVEDYVNSNPLAVSLKDTNGDYVAVGGGTQYTEDAAAPANPVGTALNMVRADTLAGLTTTDGDNVAARGTDKGELYVKHVDVIPVTGTFFQATQPVSGTVTANIGTVATLATAAKQDTGNASLSSLDTKLPSQGQALAAASTPVVLTAAQVTTLTPVAAITNFANETGGNLATIKTNTDKIPSQGQALAAASTPVVLTAAQITTLTPLATVAATQSGTWTVQPGNTANNTPWLVTDSPATSGGLSKFHLVGAATDNATNLKASAGQVYSITAFNLNAAPRYLKFHNTAVTPTAGSGVTDTFLIPGNTAGAGVVLNLAKGIAFATGISITLVTGIADSNTTAISASEVVVNIYYK